MISGWIIAYIPFIRYVFLLLFAAVFVSVIGKLRRSKTLLAKIVYFIIIGFILLLVIALWPFFI